MRRARPHAGAPAAAPQGGDTFPGPPGAAATGIEREQRLSAWADLLQPPHPESRRRKYAGRVGGLVAVLAILGYLYWRVRYTMPDHGTDRVFGWMLVVFEGMPLLPLLVRLFTLWSVDSRPPPRRNKHRALPPVVVLVPTYNEPPEILVPTVAAACALDPAHETWVLDDGDRPWVAEMCEAYGARYVSREVHDHAKAGNLNNALRLMREEQHPAEVIAILDCDHVPLAGFLSETLDWFDDDRIALVQAPQAYFNEDAYDGDGYAGEQGVFFHVLMVARNGRRTDPPWCGSTSLVRRSALEEIGGIAQETVTEDLHTTLRLLQRGWRTTYHNQVLAVGLAPDTPEQYLIQRRRWALGAMQVFVTERLGLPHRWLTLRNQVEYLASAFWWFEGAITAGMLVVPALILLFGIEASRADPLLYASLMGAMTMLRVTGANLLYRGYLRWRHALELRVTRIPIGLACLWWLMTRRELRFEVTPKGGSGDRTPSPVPRVLIVLAGLVTAVLAYGVVTLIAPVPWSSSRTATLTGGFWLLWGEVFLLLGISRLRDPDFYSTRRVAHRFDAHATVTVDGVRAELLDISTSGLRVRFGSEVPTGATAQVVLPGADPIVVQRAWLRDAQAAFYVADGDLAALRTLARWIFATPPSTDHAIPDGLPAAAVMGDLGSRSEPREAGVARRDDIQGMRALAVALVVATHAGLSLLPGGFVGVDVFFVISGFLITTLMLREFRLKRTISLRRFYARRALRILPAAAVVSAATLLLAGLTQSTSRMHDIAHDAVWSGLFVENIHLIRESTDYFASVAVSPFQHNWSLSVEEQFYIVWPLSLLLLLRALNRHLVTLVACAGVLLSLAASISQTASSPDAAYFSTFTRTHELGIGVLLALLAPAAVPASRLFAWLAGAAGLLLILGSAYVITDDGFPGWHALVPTAGAALLLAAGVHRQVGLSRLLGRQPLRWLGDISYSLYLWHWPLLHLGPDLLPDGWADWQQKALLVALSVLLADLTFRFVEQPFLKRRLTSFRGVRPMLLWPVTVGTVIAVAFGGTTIAAERQDQASKGVRAWYAAHASACGATDADTAVSDVSSELSCANRLAALGAPVPADVDPLAASQDSFDRQPFCWQSFGRDKAISACDGTVDDDRRTVMLIGDSHMGQWLPGLQRVAADRDLNFVPFVRPGCKIWDVDPGSHPDTAEQTCIQYREKALAAVREAHPDVLILASLTDGATGNSASTEGEAWREGITETIATYSSLVDDVVVLSDTPLRDGSVPDCLGATGNRLDDCAGTVPDYFKATNDFIKTTARGAGAHFVAVWPLICVDDVCPAATTKMALFSDESHVSASWSKHVAPALEELLAPYLPTTG